MQASDRNAPSSDSALDRFVAELTGAAYQIALRHSSTESWADLELELWKSLSETVQKWRGELGRKKPRTELVSRAPERLVRAAV
jgi:hypothetical protein